MIQSIQKLTLKQARLLRGFSLERFAKQLGVTAKTCRTYEINPNNIPIATVYKICSILNFDFSEIDFFNSSAKETDSND